MKSKKIVLAGLMSICFLQSALFAETVVEGISLETIAQHQTAIQTREARFLLARRGLTIGASALTLAALYKWYYASGTQPTTVLTQNAEDTLKAVYEMMKKQLELTTAQAGATAAPINTASGWTSSVFNNWTFNAAMFAGFIAIQHTWSKIAAGFNYIYYTFSYSWFVKHRTHLDASFDELERVAYAYDREKTSEAFRDSAFIDIFNKVLRECEKVLAFMFVQNKELEAHSLIHARHMRVVTGNLMHVIETYQEALKDGKDVPTGYFSWKEFAKAFRDSVQRHGDSYTYNEERIFSSLSHEEDGQ